jgi:hypothetical protein
MLTWDDPAWAEPDLPVYGEHLLLQSHGILPHPQQVSHRVDKSWTTEKSKYRKAVEWSEHVSG